MTCALKRALREYPRTLSIKDFHNEYEEKPEMDVNGNPPDATGTGMRMRPVGAAIMRPIGAVASSGVGTELSNHEATKFNLGRISSVDIATGPNPRGVRSYFSRHSSQH